MTAFWYGALAAMFATYAVLDGFDFGAGILHLVVAKTDAERPLVQFVSFVLDDAQNTWTQLLPQQTGTPYRHAKLVLFRDLTQSGCGGAESATGLRRFAKPMFCYAVRQLIASVIVTAVIAFI